jgi:hypothetical protein
VMSGLGTITGSMESSKVAALGKILGVAAVELERSLQVPPPDSEIQ